MMSIQKYQEEMKSIHDYIVEYLDNDDKVEENNENLKWLFRDIKIHDDQYKIKPLLYIVANIAKNHYHKTHYFHKIWKKKIWFDWTVNVNFDLKTPNGFLNLFV